MKSWGALLAAATLLTAAAGDPEPASFEAWRFNPRERTSRAIEAVEQGRPEDAATLAAAARRLAPDDPLTAFNAGTAELAAHQTDRALASFEEALQQLYREPDDDGAQPLAAAPRQLVRLSPAARELAPDLQYNLGNARLDAGDPAGAVAAYEQTLRLEPGHQGAKFNLELALAELARRNASASSDDPSRAAQEERQGGSQGAGGDEESPEGPQNGPQPEGEQPDAAPRERGGETPPQADESALPRSADTRLQHFEDQPDMNASEAAAILEAVENLERQQRRDAARERAQQKVRGGKDW